MKSLIVILALFISSIPQDKFEIEVHVTGIRNMDGNIILSAFNSEDSFLKEIPMVDKVIAKEHITNGELFTTMSLPAGVWGIALLDDENSDGEMKYSRLGIPREGFGFSDFELKGMKKPHLKDFAFTLDERKPHTLIKIRYIL